MAAKRLISDKTRTASIFNGFRNDPLYTHLVMLIGCEEICSVDVFEAEKIEAKKFCTNQRGFLSHRKAALRPRFLLCFPHELPTSF